MAARVSESIVLRTYPLREADLIVSFLTRDSGKLRGVARRARKPGSSFGSGLERLSHVRLFYFASENLELAAVDSCELIGSRFGLASEYELTVALDYLAEVSEHILPLHEPNEKFFRLLLAVTGYLLDAGLAGLRPAVNYFTLWSVRLAGILPPIEIDDEERAIAEEMLRTPLSSLAPRQWSRAILAGMRRQLCESIEEHVERRLVTSHYLETL